MDIPCSKPITNYDEIGNGASITVTLADIVDELPIPNKLKSQMRALSDTHEEASLHILVESSDTVKHEGRGRYFDSCFDRHNITLYSKGVGCMDILKLNARKGKNVQFGAFGPIPEEDYNGNTSGYFFDSVNHPLHFPRVIGAGYTYDENREFLHALRVMVNLIRTESYTSIDDLFSNGVTIPVSAARFPGLTKYVREKTSHEFKDSKWKWNDDIELGSVTMVVPSSQRTNITDKYRTNRKEYSICIARALRKLYESSGAIFSPFSTHMQNFYFAPNSVCPHSDNSDLLFDLKPEERVGMFIRKVTDMVFSANSDWGYRIDEHAFYRELTQEDVSLSYVCLPLLKYYALEMEKKLGNTFKPDSKLIGKIMTTKQYHKIEKKRRSDSLDDVKDNIPDVEVMSLSDMRKLYEPKPVSNSHSLKSIDFDEYYPDRNYIKEPLNHMVLS